MDKIYGKEVCRMVVMSKIYDNRINSCNLYVETTFGEYLSFARDIIKNNELQRKRVRASKSVCSLLKNDLKRGCLWQDHGCSCNGYSGCFSNCR